ncbi:hypothetical protein FHR81_004168 [Actinoalloteichus hoggarensis]|uniref:Uncharacterized protein n=1 Tax=Actinoalloteichus hoggarensis TaxID=1470176 RepID=A0A221W9E6_9PSEU|nr:hypothetical protein AHOG_24345 [Actinoalloteichus hoggarensis]MBB5923101.1 hypothetical protein [Actinoalloteichus hoggarensis]
MTEETRAVAADAPARRAPRAVDIAPADETIAVAK